LKEHKESHPIYIAVDPTKLARCRWCGTYKSEFWGEAESGLYCSSDCHYANHTDEFLVGFFCAVILIPFILVNLLSSPGLIIGGTFLFWLMVAPLLVYGLRSRRYRAMVPRGSRSHDVSNEQALLRTMASTVSCPKCDGNIDIGKVGDDRTYHCEYCGASGKIEIIRPKND
jgi:hypothetical protein